MRDRDQDKRKRRGSDDRDADRGLRKRPKYVEAGATIDYKDYELLRKFLTEHGKILPGRITGATAKQQRQIKQAVRRARVMGLLP